MRIMRKPNVLLINPDPNPHSMDPSSGFSGPPMAILAIGSFLKVKGVEVKLVDSRLYKKGLFPYLSSLISDFDVVGFSVMTAQIKDALKISNFIKQSYREKIIVWGGVHPTLFPEQVLKNPLVDFTVIGEGEDTAYELIRAVYGGGNAKDYSKIKGIGFRDNDSIIVNPRRETIDLDSLPFQDYGLVEAEKYINTYFPFLGKRRELVVQTSRGCPHRCSFCINYVERNYNVWRPRDPNGVIEEIKYLKDRYKINAVSFRDENLFVNRIHSLALIAGLRGLGVRWFANVRADYFNERHVSEALLARARNAGAAYLGIGAESGSNRVLGLISKDITTEQILFSAEMMRKSGIAASYSFLTGLPGETREETLQTVSLMKDIKNLHPKVVFAGPQILRPYPGGNLYELCVKSGYRSPSSLEEWSEQDTGKFGELSLRHYPWIKNQSFVLAVSTYAPAALNYQFTKDLGFARRIYACIGKIRLKFNFWFLPYEYKLGMWLLRWVYKIKCAVSAGL